MPVRFYLLPVERVGQARGPQYLPWRFDPDPANSVPVQWQAVYYGLVDKALVAANVTTAQHNTLTSHADVFALPTNLDGAITAAGKTAAETALEGMGIPGQWVSQVGTYRELARAVSGMFLFMQRLTELTGADPTKLQGWSLNTQYGNLPQLWQNALVQAAVDLGYSPAGLTAATTMRVILKNMADQWGARPVVFGSLATL